MNFQFFEITYNSMPVQMCLLMSLYNKALRVTFLEGQSMCKYEFKLTTVEFQGCFKEVF